MLIGASRKYPGSICMVDLFCLDRTDKSVNILLACKIITRILCDMKEIFPVDQLIAVCPYHLFHTFGIIERIRKTLDITSVKLRHDRKCLVGIVVRNDICELIFCQHLRKIGDIILTICCYHKSNITFFALDSWV